jgi:hypothetical protein
MCRWQRFCGFSLRCSDGDCVSIGEIGEVDFWGFFSICYVKIQTAKDQITVKIKHKRRFSIFLTLPMKKWLFNAQKSEK